MAVSLIRGKVMNSAINDEIVILSQNFTHYTLRHLGNERSTDDKMEVVNG